MNGSCNSVGEKHVYNHQTDAHLTIQIYNRKILHLNFYRFVLLLQSTQMCNGLNITKCKFSFSGSFDEVL